MFKKIQKFMRPVIRAVKKGLMVSLLVLAYIFVFGPTAVFLKLFRRDLLPRPCAEGQARWLDAAGYEPDEDDLLRQA
ncbi:MAG: hypothetical protein V1882_10005 [Candidatus Omnitrophota bacterium]